MPSGGKWLPVTRRRAIVRLSLGCSADGGSNCRGSRAAPEGTPGSDRAGDAPSEGSDLSCVDKIKGWHEGRLLYLTVRPLVVNNHILSVRMCTRACEFVRVREVMMRSWMTTHINLYLTLSRHRQQDRQVIGPRCET